MFSANLAHCKRKATSILGKHGRLEAAAQGMAGLSESGLPRLLLDAIVIDCSIFPQEAQEKRHETIMEYCSLKCIYLYHIYIYIYHIYIYIYITITFIYIYHIYIYIYTVYF